MDIAGALSRVQRSLGQVVAVAWIELHQPVWTHRKTYALAAQLGLDDTYAAAHVIRLWTWALDNAPRGDLSDVPDRAIALGAGWRKNATTFVSALITAGFVDDDRQLHDWMEYAGRLIQKREANALRMRNARGTHTTTNEDARAEHVRRTVHSTSVACAGATVPDQTIPDRDRTPLVSPVSGGLVTEVPLGVEDTATADAESPPTHPPQGTANPVPKPDSVAEVFEHYRQHIQPQARLHATDKIKRRLGRWKVADLKAAIDHFAADSWQMEHNAHRGAEWFFASDGRIEQYVNLKPSLGVKSKNGQTAMSVIDDATLAAAKAAHGEIQLSPAMEAALAQKRTA